MELAEIEVRQNELDTYADWLTDNEPMDYMQYYHQRSIELDAMRPGDAE